MQVSELPHRAWETGRQAPLGGRAEVLEECLQHTAGHCGQTKDAHTTGYYNNFNDITCFQSQSVEHDVII